MLTRRQFGLGLSTCAASVVARPAKSQTPAADGRIAIVDAPVNVSDYVLRLRTNGVRVIGRYFAREAQPELGLPFKRIAYNKAADGKPEVKAITEKGLNVLSAYQYYSGGAKKFLYGLDDTGSPKAEAEADANAARDQAKMVGQPDGTAIYFGVDYNCRKGAKGPRGKPEIEFVIDYFKTINAIVGPHYRIGTYANGYVNRILRCEGLISLSWVSPSVSYDETTDYISSGNWHLFQNQVDRRWYETQTCPSGLDVDTNLQKSSATDIGVWGGERLSPDRVTAIYDQRRFAVRSTPIFKSPDGQVQIDKTRCVQVDQIINGKKTKRWVRQDEKTVPRLHNVRVLADMGEWLHVDVDDDGAPDGYCRAKDFTKGLGTMPPWRQATALPTACPPSR